MIKRMIATAMLVAAPVFAFAANYIEGEQYQELATAIPTSVAKDKVEVFEFFWYGCPHCGHFEPALHAWQKAAPDDVVLTQSPAMWNKAMALHAKLFYTVQVLGLSDTMNEQIFTMFNANPKVFSNEAQIKQFFIDNGVSEKKFLQAFNSFGVSSLVRQADARARGAQIEGTPEMNVNGRYRVSARMAGSQAEMLKVVDFLIEKERQRIAAQQ